MNVAAVLGQIITIAIVCNLSVRTEKMEEVLTKVVTKERIRTGRMVHVLCFY